MRGASICVVVRWALFLLTCNRRILTRKFPIKSDSVYSPLTKNKCDLKMKSEELFKGRLHKINRDQKHHHCAIVGEFERISYKC